MPEPGTLGPEPIEDREDRAASCCELKQRAVLDGVLLWSSVAFWEMSPRLKPAERPIAQIRDVDL